MKVYLTSIAAVAAVRRDAAAAQTSAFVGPGRVLGIMRRPPLWAFPLLEGAVIGLMPTHGELTAALEAGARSSSAAFAEYASRLRARWGMRRRTRDPYASGELRVAMPSPDGESWDGERWAPAGFVQDGDTLVCMCGRGKPCHRWVAASILDSAGWQVVSDGGDDERVTMAHIGGAR